MKTLLKSIEIEELKYEAMDKLGIKEENGIEVYHSEISCPSSGYPRKGVVSTQAFVTRTIVAFRKTGEKEGLKYLNKVWSKWDGGFPLSEQRNWIEFIK